jgi:tetratricopeptide (TPR) repeat protein
MSARKRSFVLNATVSASAEFHAAINAAPWLAAAYLNLALVEQQQKDYDMAVRNYRLYTMAAPNAEDLETVKKKIIELEYLQERAPQEQAAEFLSLLAGDWYKEGVLVGEHYVQTWRFTLNGGNGFSLAPVRFHYEKMGDINDLHGLGKYQGTADGKQLNGRWNPPDELREKYHCSQEFAFTGQVTKARAEGHSGQEHVWLIIKFTPPMEGKCGKYKSENLQKYTFRGDFFRDDLELPDTR